MASAAMTTTNATSAGPPRKPPGQRSDRRGAKGPDASSRPVRVGRSGGAPRGDDGRPGAAGATADQRRAADAGVRRAPGSRRSGRAGRPKPASGRATSRPRGRGGSGAPHGRGRTAAGVTRRRGAAVPSAPRSGRPVPASRPRARRGRGASRNARPNGRSDRGFGARGRRRVATLPAGRSNRGAGRLVAATGRDGGRRAAAGPRRTPYGATARGQTATRDANRRGDRVGRRSRPMVGPGRRRPYRREKSPSRAARRRRGVGRRGEANGRRREARASAAGPPSAVPTPCGAGARGRRRGRGLRLGGRRGALYQQLLAPRRRVRARSRS